MTSSTPYDEWGLWSYRDRWTSGVGGTTTISHDISAGVGNVIHVIGFRASAVIAATGTLRVSLIDEDAAEVVAFNILAAAAAPSATIPRLNDDIVSSTSSPVAATTGGVWLSGTDLRLRAVPGTLASGDTVDIQILARVLNAPGTVSVIATGLYTQAVTVNEVY